MVKSETYTISSKHYSNGTVGYLEIELVLMKRLITVRIYANCDTRNLFSFCVTVFMVNF